MMNEPERHRERIPLKPINRLPVIPDDLVFTKNKCSLNARKIVTQTEKTTVNVWFDKHYHDRHQHGDETGKREGIDMHLVESLVLKAINPLILYSSIVDGFTFLNHPDHILGNPKRVVVTEITDDLPLNVVIEVHFIDVSEYEITVKTAMKIDDFRITDGQYMIEIEGDITTLKRRVRNNINTILSI